MSHYSQIMDFALGEIGSLKLCFASRFLQHEARHAYGEARFLASDHPRLAATVDVQRKAAELSKADRILRGVEDVSASY